MSCHVSTVSRARPLFRFYLWGGEAAIYSAKSFDGDNFLMNWGSGKFDNSLVCYGFDRDRTDQSTKFGTLIPYDHV